MKIGLFDHIEGDHFTILGLPLLSLFAFLRREQLLEVYHYLKTYPTVHQLTSWYSQLIAFPPLIRRIRARLVSELCHDGRQRGVSERWKEPAPTRLSEQRYRVL